MPLSSLHHKKTETYKVVYINPSFFLCYIDININDGDIFSLSLVRYIENLQLKGLQ